MVLTDVEVFVTQLIASIECSTLPQFFLSYVNLKSCQKQLGDNLISMFTRGQKGHEFQNIRDGLKLCD